MALRAALLLVLLGLLAGCTGGPAPAALTQAEARPEPQGGPVRQQPVALPLRWDSLFPGRGGTAVFTFALPDQAQTALMLRRAGNQVRVTLNGALLLEIGTPGDPYFDAGKASQRVALPAALWLAAGNRLQIEVSVQAQRAGGLGRVLVGSDAEIDAELARIDWPERSLPVAYAATLLLIGLLAGALWWRQRDPLYGCFSLAALAGILRYVDPIAQPAPLPWPLWGGVLAAAYALHLGLMARFILLVLGRNPRWLVRSIHVVLGCVVLLAAASFAFARMGLWTAALALLLLLGLVCLGVALQEARRRGPGIAWIMLGAGVLLLAAGAHDLLRVRTGLAGSGGVPLAPHALFAFVLILSGIFVHRFNRSVTEHRALAASLAERVAEREQQLRQAFEALRAQRDEQAAAAERTRIMREVHDGIGAQLVGLLNMVADERNDRAVLQEQVRLALDEMRLAVDSLQPAFGELTAVLATLRYRLQPRLAAAGIELVWDMAALPDTALPSPQAALHLQRILLEAFTNVLKHARATRVTMQVRWRGEPHGAVVIRMADNGVGLRSGTEAAGGHGLQNMRSRASTIGATLVVRCGDAGGTDVDIEWPLAASLDRRLG